MKSAEERIAFLEETVKRLQVETDVLRELMIKQVAVNNITFKGKYDEVLIQMAKEYENRGLEEDHNRFRHEALRQYLQQESGSVE